MPQLLGEMARLTGAMASGNLAVRLSQHQLFVRKDFSKSLGVTIVVLGSWSARSFGTCGCCCGRMALFATALIPMLSCIYGRQPAQLPLPAQYRGVPGLENHEPFDLETPARISARIRLSIGKGQVRMSKE
jgi:hypothetical protein